LIKDENEPTKIHREYQNDREKEDEPVLKTDESKRKRERIEKEQLQLEQPEEVNEYKEETHQIGSDKTQKEIKEKPFEETTEQLEVKEEKKAKEQNDTFEIGVEDKNLIEDNTVYSSHKNEDEPVNQLDKDEDEGTSRNSYFLETPAQEVEESSPQKPLERKFDRYYRHFLVQRDLVGELSYEDKEKYSTDLKENRCDQFTVLSLQTIEQILFSLTKNMDLIGELPISEICFKRLVQVTRVKALKNGLPDPKSVPPTLFLTLMVFCARYSHETASKFWEPYVQEVWGKKQLTQTFQSRCRKHFINCRQDLELNQGKQFFLYFKGGVVRPVYQHAIIPYNLESHFVEWMINNFEEVLRYSVDDLPQVLAKDKSLSSLPYTFQHFIRDKETEDTAANLIRNIAYAVKRFQVTNQTKEVLSMMDSVIERTLFEKIIQEILSKATGQEQIRTYSPRLQWVWDKDEYTLGLRLSNVRSSADEKPDFVLCADESTKDLINSKPSRELYPRQFAEDDSWEIEPITFLNDVPHNGFVYVLSNAYDVKKPEEQEKHIIFKRRIPDFPSPFLCFRIYTNRRYSLGKDIFDSEGVWLTYSKKEYEILKDGDQPLKFKNMSLVRSLKSEGYINARKYNISSPITIYCDGEYQRIEFSEKTEFFCSITGKKNLKGLSKDIPQIFQSYAIQLKIHHARDLMNFERVCLSVFVDKKFEKSTPLLGLLNEQSIREDDDSIQIDLSPIIKRQGVYTIYILSNLQSLVDDVTEFVVLDDSIEIIGPDPEKCYSPQSPLSIQIKGINEDTILTYESEKIKLMPFNDGIQLTWPMVKSSKPGIILVLERSNIHLKWPINRVSAWMEPGSDKNEFMKGKESEVNLIIRGYRNQRYQIRIQDESNSITDELDAYGCFDRKLLETKLYDLLREAKRVTSIVEILINGMSWVLFRYISIPNIQVDETKISYDINQGLSIILSNFELLKGNYRLFVKDQNGRLLIEKESDYLRKEMLIPGKLEAGNYNLEITVDNQTIYLVEGIIITHQIAEVKDPHEIAIKRNQEVGKQELFQAITLSPGQLGELEEERNNLIPILNQLISINLRSKWVNLDPLEDGFVNLIPAWAVTRYPMRLESIDNRRIFHVFPERLVFGGIAGQGSIDLKIGRNKTKAYVAWKPIDQATYSEMWIGFPAKMINDKYSKIDPQDYWPGYQCIDCGEIVGYEHGTYHNFPPSIINAHIHGDQRKRSEQFIDTVYSKKRRLLIKTDFYKDELLDQRYSPEEIMKDLSGTHLDYKADVRISVPVFGFSALDYKIAISELSRSLQNRSKNFHIKEAMSRVMQLNQINTYLRDNSKKAPFASFRRLFRCFNSNSINSKVSTMVLVLSLILRSKAHKKEIYIELLKCGNLTEVEIMDLSILFYSCCPKLLEWAIAWTEIFFVHSIS